MAETDAEKKIHMKLLRSCFYRKRRERDGTGSARLVFMTAVNEPLQMESDLFY
jgi:hypothetical protein